MKRRDLLSVSLGLGLSGCLRLQQTNEAPPGGNETSERTDGASESDSSERSDPEDSDSITLSEQWTEFEKSGYIWTDEDTFYFNQTNGAGAASPQNGILWLSDNSQVVRANGLIGDGFAIQGTQAIFGFRPDRDENPDTGAYYSSYDTVTGDEMWSFITDSEGDRLVPTGAAIANGTVVVGSSASRRFGQESCAYGLEADSGEELWSISEEELEDEPISDIIAYNGNIYIIQPEAGTYIIDPTSGSTIERVESLRAPPSGGRKHNNVFFSPLSGQFIAYNLDDNSINWRGQGPGDLRNRNPAAPAVDDDVVAIGNSSSEIFVYESQTGELRWQSSISQDISAISLTSSQVWVGGVSTITAYDRNDGQRVHESEHDYRDEWGEGEIGVIDNTLLVAGHNLTKAYTIEN